MMRLTSFMRVSLRTTRVLARGLSTSPMEEYEEMHNLKIAFWRKQQAAAGVSAELASQLDAARGTSSLDDRMEFAQDALGPCRVSHLRDLDGSWERSSQKWPKCKNERRYGVLATNWEVGGSGWRLLGLSWGILARSWAILGDKNGEDGPR